MDNAYTICKDCKVGILTQISDESITNDAERKKFLMEDHRGHTIDMVTEEVFTLIMMPQGYKDVERPALQPLPSRSAELLAAQADNKRLSSKEIPQNDDYANEKRKILVDKGYRPDWDEYFLRIAEVVAQRGTCSRLQVGAVLVKDRKIIATGYNGAPAGLRHCDHRQIETQYVDEFHDTAVYSDTENGHCVIAEHAERNALLSCDQPKSNSTMYVTATPCENCTRNCVTAGVKRIVYRSEYKPSPSVRLLCEHAGILLESKSNG